MMINQLPLPPTRWRRLHPQLRAELRQVLGEKAAIINRQVLDVAKDLIARDASLLAWHLYQEIDGQPFTSYQGCGLGLTMDLRAAMAEDQEPWCYGSEDAPLLLPQECPRACGGQ